MTGASDITASSRLLSSLYTSYERELGRRVTGGTMTSKERNTKLTRARNNIMSIMKEITKNIEL